MIDSGVIFATLLSMILGTVLEALLFVMLIHVWKRRILNSAYQKAVKFMNKIFLERFFKNNYYNIRKD